MSQDNPFPEIDDYLSVDENADLLHYLPFLRLLEAGRLTFCHFNKYSFDELLRIRRIYALSGYLENKSNHSNNNDVI